jgi:hypothetical protein
MHTAPVRQAFAWLSDRVSKYIACENAPSLQNLGGVALREEALPPGLGRSGRSSRSIPMAT